MSDDQKFFEDESTGRAYRGDEAEVEGHRAYEPADPNMKFRNEDDEPEVEGHLFTSGSAELKYEAERKINRKIN
jgi:hypothetical protein